MCEGWAGWSPGCGSGPGESRQGPHDAGPCGHAEAVEKAGFHHSERPLNDFKHADEEGE